MTDQNYKYIIHLKAGDKIKLDGIPYEFFNDADLGGDTKPNEVGLDVEEVTNEELKELENTN